MALLKRTMLTGKRSCSCGMPGVWRAVAHSEGAAVVFHSPRACAHVAREMSLGGHYRALAHGDFRFGRYTAPLVSSDLGDTQAVFGGAQRLEACVSYVVERYRSQYVVIANSCVGGVIGDDTAAVAQTLEERLGLPVISVPVFGFLDGEYPAGFQKTALALIERFMQPQAKRANTAVIVGDYGMDGAEGEELGAALEAFGCEVHCCFPRYASLAQIQAVPSCAYSIPLSSSVRTRAWLGEICDTLDQKFDMPYVKADDCGGLQGLWEWLGALGAFFGKPEVAAALERQALERLAAFTQAQRDAARKRAVLCLGRPLASFSPRWALEAMEYSAVELTGVVLFREMPERQKTALADVVRALTSAPVVDEDEADAFLSEAELLFTTHEIARPDKPQFQLPFVPPSGIGGFLALLEKLRRYIRRAEGGVSYGW